MLRIATFSYARRAIHFSTRHSADLIKHQNRISSGLDFELPSEAPISFRQVTSLRSRFAELTADRNSIDRSSFVLNASVDQLESFNLAVTKAKGLVQQGIQAVDEDQFSALATELDGLVEHMKSIALAQFDEKYLYGGVRTNQPPFTFSEADVVTGLVTSTYNGSNERSRANVGDSISVDTFYSGQEVFGSLGREETVFVGNTGAASGIGTDTLTGFQQLQVTHGTTTYAGTSGITAGTSSADSDTVIGPLGKHQLTIIDTAGDGSAGTIQLNGGESIAFTNADTDLRVRGPGGQEVFVNTTAIAAGFNGTIDLEATGNLSVDGGASFTAIDYSDNQIVTDSATGKFVTVDSREINEVGNEELEFLGTFNAIELIAAISADMKNVRGFSRHEQAETLDRRLGELESIAENVFATIGEQATSLSTLNSLGERVDDLSLSVESRASEIQATDLPDAILRLEATQSLLQYTHAVTASLSSLGLLEFIR